MIIIKAAWFNRLEQYIETSLYEQAVACLINHLSDVLAAEMKTVFQTVARIPKQYFKTANQKYFLGHLSYLNNSKELLAWALESLKLSGLKEKSSIASYLSLKSLDLYVTEPEQSLYLAHRAVANLHQQDATVFRGLVYFHYAKQLENAALYRMAARYFEEAAKAFEVSRSQSMAVNCYVYEGLSLYALGDHQSVIKLCSEALNQAELSQINSWNMLKLPLALSHYALNNISLASGLLTEAEGTVAASQIPRLQAEVTLCKYRIGCIKNKGIDKLLNSLEAQSKSKIIAQLVEVIKTEADLYDDEQVSDIVKNWIAVGCNNNTPNFVVEAMFKLKLAGRAKDLSIDFLHSRFKQACDRGHRLHIQSLALYLTEYFWQAGVLERAGYYLQIAYNIYTDSQTSVNFFNRKITFTELIEKLDTRLAEAIQRSTLCVQA